MTRSNPDETAGRSTEEWGPAAEADPRCSVARKAGPGRAAPAREVLPPPRKRVFVFAVAGLTVLLGYGAYEHWRTDERAARTQQDTINFVPDVQTVAAQLESQPTKLVLPGQIEAFLTSTIYPRATGYVAERRVDIGSHVRKGDLLIRIAAPDLDAQLKQSQGQLEQTKAALGQSTAQLAQAKANLALASITSQRFKKLTTEGYQTVQNNDNQNTAVQSQQANVDSAAASIKVASANIQAQEATVEHLAALVSYERVVAPFDGVVTTRGVEKGDLVNADTKTGNPLFTIANEDVLRVTIHVPQANAFAIRDGLLGTAYLPQKPDRTFSGRVARSSIELLNSARTLDAEVDIANPDGALKAGAYVDVTFDVPRLHPSVTLPATALIFNQDGLQAAVVRSDRVHMQKLTIDRDLGKTIELRDGLEGDEQIVDNPPANLQEGARVKVTGKPAAKEARR